MTASHWEMFEEVHLRRFFDQFEVDCVYDVGANRGQYRDVLRGAVGYKGTIISFEPVPELAAVLKDRREEARDENWHIECLALDKEAGTATFNVMNNNVFSSLKEPDNEDIEIFREMNRISRSVTVEKDTLLNQHLKYRNKLGFRRPFLKMDTQGNDVSVFLGAGTAISQIVGLQSELSLRRIYKDTPMYDEAISIYKLFGFVLSALVPNNAGHFPDLVEIDCIMYKRQ